MHNFDDTEEKIFRKLIRYSYFDQFLFKKKF